ncbi:MAG: right-handed parallel beta-helix repeat-containing protein [Candidatus Bathyarchaeota archaeon]|nr:right-handed parallel beta-helix repeat-containing protein [Candidatus Bathyarchaeota archaeon]
MRKQACIVLLLTLAVTGLFVFPNIGSAYTISGHIQANTTWTAANSPYNLNNNVFVDSGVTLTIEPGVTVNLGPYMLQVNGALTARGTSSNRIYFTGSGADSKIEFTQASTPWSDSSSTGCIIDYALISSVSAVVTFSSPKISNSYFVASTVLPIAVNGGNPRIVGNVINFGTNTNGIHIFNGNPRISDNYIKGQNANYGIFIEGTSTSTINNNDITNCYTGIYAVGAATITNNRIQNNLGDGIRNENPTSTIQFNALVFNLCGLSVSGNIQHNTITNNIVGVWGPHADATITNNNIYGNYNASAGAIQNVHLTETDNLSLINNWWGTTDVDAINQTILDRKADPVNLGVANFVPFLTSKDVSAPDAPASIPVPTQPPTPAPYTSAAPSATPTVQPTALPYHTEQPTPTTTPRIIQPSSIPVNPLLGGDDLGDIANVVVIVLATLTTVLIIVVINRRFHRKPTAPPQTDGSPVSV